MQSRRQFLRQVSLSAALSSAAPPFLARSIATTLAPPVPTNPQPAGGSDDTILVALELVGGNDGLNTVIPFADDEYHKARPNLALPAHSVLKLNDSLGLHPALAGLHTLYEAGSLAVVPGVGYPNPSRSHRRSAAIWQTASDPGQLKPHGWIGRYFDHLGVGSNASIGISLGETMPQIFAARRPLGICLTNTHHYQFLKSDRPEQTEQDLSEITCRKLNRPSPYRNRPEDGFGSNVALEHLERVALDAQASAAQIRAALAGKSKKKQYPSSKLAVSLHWVARLIEGGLPTRVYYLSQTGYDTHARQAGTHQRLLQALGDAVAAFFEDLKAQGNRDRVVLMTFSEFGRRVAENGSGGTDHGAGSVLFLAGSRVQAGVLGDHPSLAPADLDRGDLSYTVDFRSVYAGILEGWLRVPSQPILGQPFKSLPVINRGL